MKWKPWLFWGLFAVTMACVACFAFWLTTPKHRISKQRIEQIEPGMTLAEVEAIFGVPPGDYSSNAGTAETPLGWETVWLCDPTMLTEPEGERKVWIGEGIAVDVFFNPRVVQKPVVMYIRGSQESVLARLRRWLGL
jgi:hypothetical protein